MIHFSCFADGASLEVTNQDRTLALVHLPWLCSCTRRGRSCLNLPFLLSLQNNNNHCHRSVSSRKVNQHPLLYLSSKEVHHLHKQFQLHQEEEKPDCCPAGPSAPGRR